ncbi:MAG: hypothetical protein OXI27_09160 [Thaumarchaeota archaeon]|nr:hypothetical protein [Nitrososphaerota archaeon]
MPTYELFAEYLELQRQADSVTCSFSKIEKIIGSLPESARKYREWWSNNPSHPLMKWVLSKGWIQTKLSLKLQIVVFKRIRTGQETPHKHKIETNAEPGPLRRREKTRLISDDKTAEGIRGLVGQMFDECNAVKKATNKSLQHSLTKEFLESMSVRDVVANHPDIPKEDIKRYIKSPRRLPDILRERNEAGLDPDPELSLCIALFAVNYHDWDGDADGAGEVLRTAEAIARYVHQNPEANSTNRGVRDAHTATPRRAELVSAAIATWIAVATLHREHGLKMTFSSNQITEKIREQNLHNVSDSSIQPHVSSHCVANSPATSAPHRKTYRVEHGMYRLYKRGDPYHPSRESSPIAPLPFQIPSEYRDLRRWYDEEYCAQARTS